MRSIQCGVYHHSLELEIRNYDRTVLNAEAVKSTDHYHNLFLEVQQRDDYDCFEQIYKYYYNRLLFYTKKYIGDPELAESVVSDVFFKLWKKRKEIQINSSFQSYLYTSVRNKSLDYLRREQTRQKEDESYLHNRQAEHSNPVDIFNAEELFNKIETAINTLPKDRRRVFRMSRDEGLKYKEIAEKLGISIKTVETQMGRSLKYLREILREELDEFKFAC
ncbi:MAG: RNA polymerase sigma-70 factor [Bacteroidota bacterium]